MPTECLRLKERKSLSKSVSFELSYNIQPIFHMFAQLLTLSCWVKFSADDISVYLFIFIECLLRRQRQSAWNVKPNFPGEIKNSIKLSSAELAQSVVDACELFLINNVGKSKTLFAPKNTTENASAQSDKDLVCSLFTFNKNILFGCVSVLLIQTKRIRWWIHWE